MLRGTLRPSIGGAGRPCRAVDAWWTLEQLVESSQAVSCAS